MGDKEPVMVILPSSTRKRNVIGELIAVQEQRFRIRTEDGKVLLLTLDNGVTCQGERDLWCRSTVLVRVEFEGDPNLVSGLAKSIEPVERLGSGE
jgi:urease accessory protein UreE